MRSLFLVLFAAAAVDYNIITIAGNGDEAFSGDGGDARCASLNRPTGVDVDKAGFVYIADYNNNRIRRVSIDGKISTVAGNGERGFSGDGGPAIAAQLAGPYGVRVDDDGFLIADAINGRIRHVDREGTIRTIASGFSHPVDVVVGPDRALYVAEGGGDRVRRIDANGIITTVAGTGKRRYNGQGVYAGDGGPATQARLSVAGALAFDRDGNLFIADLGNDVVRRVDKSGTITTVAKGFEEPGGLAFESDGSLLVSGIPQVRRVTPDGNVTTVAGTDKRGFSGDHGPAKQADLSVLDHIAIDGEGNVFIADHRNSRIRKLIPQRAAIAPALSRKSSTPDVETLLAHMRAAYQSLRTADVRFIARNNERQMRGSLQYRHPSSIEATLDVDNYGQVKVHADEKIVRVVDPDFPGGVEELPWSLQNVRRAVAANLEIVSIWDWQRQLNTGEGGNMAADDLRIGADQTWKGKRWTILEERAGSDVYRYFIDPATALIWRTTATRGDGTVFYDGEIEKLRTRGERASRP